MSKEGDQQNKKDGGVLKGTHETNRNSINCFSSPFKLNDSLNNLTENINKSVKIQDGVSISDDNDITGGLTENLPFLSDEIDSYERAVVENNTEWLKSRCKIIDNIAFDLSATTASDVGLPLVNEEANEMDSLPTLTVTDTDIKIDQSQSGIETLTYDTDPMIPLCSEGGSLPGDSIYLLQQSTSNVNQNLALDSAQNVRADSALSVLPSSVDLGIDKELSQVTKNLFTVNEDLHQKNVVLMASDANNFTANTTDVGSLGDSNMRLCVKDGVLSIITKQDESEEGTSTLLNEYAEGLDTLETSKKLEVETQHARASEEIVAVNPVAERKLHQPKTPATQNRLVPIQPAEEKNKPIVLYQNQTGNDKSTIQADYTLATISISNDKTSNSTKILVDTDQGQRLYQINIADFLSQEDRKAQSASSVVVVPYQEVPTNIEENGSSQTDSGKSQVPVSQDSQAQLTAGVTGQDYYLLPLDENSTGSDTAILGSIPIPAQNGNNEFQEPEEKEGKKLFYCSEPGCDKFFKKSFKLTIHKMVHTGERPFKCSEPGCEWAFTTNYRLKRHEESHKGNKDHVCSTCGKHFSTIYNLNSHLRLHERPLNEVCTVEGCGESFPTKRQLDMHMKNHDGLEKTYKCPHEGCNKVFFSAHCVGSHPRVHQQEHRELRCTFEGCGRVFEKKCRLTQHMRSHTGEKPYVCDYEGCNWAFSTASKLTRHMTKHTGTRKWLCIVCGKGFRRGEHLKGHMITHSGMKPFSCPAEGCNAKFVAKSSLYVHMKKHDPKDEGQEIMYHCPMDGCDQKYTCKASLRQHIIKHFPMKDPNDVSHLDIIPFLNEGWGEDGKVISNESASVIEKVEEKWKPLQSDEVPVVVAAAEASAMDGEVNPVAFICETDTSGNVKINIASEPALNVKPVKLDDQSTPNTSPEELSCPMTATIKTEFGLEKISFQPKISRKNIAKNRGSARTDYQSNLELSDRARKRRKLLREKAEGSSVNVEESRRDITDSNAELPSVSADFVAETLSQGITFRDPETGVLYVQTQLLQDDPPHPDMFIDESVLKAELSLPVTSDTELTDQSLPGAEFVGSTINLQDLVG